MRAMTWEDWNPYTGINPWYIASFFVICLFVSLAYEYIQWIREKKSGRRQQKGRGFLIGITFFYVYTIFCATIFKRAGAVEREIHFQLLWTLKAALQTGKWIYWYYIVGNILMFVPLGFVLLHLHRSREGRRSDWKSFLCTIFLCLLVSVLIEGIQYLTQTGMSEADDLLHNTLGGGIGGVMYFMFRYFSNKSDGEST